MTVQELTAGIGPDQQFARYLAEGQLQLQVCGRCHAQIFFPRVVCPHCGSRELRWEPATTGIVYSTTVVRRRPDRGGDYNVAIIELEGGARMLSRVEGLEPDAVVVGLPVEAYIGTRDGEPLVLFVPQATA